MHFKYLDFMDIILQFCIYSWSKKSLHIEKIKKKQTSKNALISKINNQLFLFFSNICFVNIGSAIQRFFSFD